MRNLFYLSPLVFLLFFSCGDDEEDQPTPEVQRVIQVEEKAPEPIACFEASTARSLVGSAIVFKNCSENAVRYEWDFGNGEQSDFRNPSHSFAQPGKYTVRLSAFNKNNVADEAEVEVQIGHYRVESIVLNRFEPTSNIIPEDVNCYFRLRNFLNNNFVTTNWESVNRSNLPYKWTYINQGNFITTYNQSWIAELYISPSNTSIFSNWQFYMDAISDDKTIVLSNDSAEVIIDLQFIP